MNNNPKFSNIKSKDIMKEILSFLSMCKILKLNTIKVYKID